MPAENYEERVREAYIRSITAAGVDKKDADDIASSNANLHQFQRAENQAFREEQGQVGGSVALKDLVAYLEAKYPAVSCEQEASESVELVIRLDGGVQESTFPEYKAQWMAALDQVNLNPKSDQEFADLEKLVKDLKGAEKAIGDAITEAINGNKEVADLLSSVREFQAKTRETRLAGEKVIKNQKEAIKKTLIAGAEEELREYVMQCRAEYSELSDDITLCDGIGPVREAVKGKRKIDKLQDAVSNAMELIKGDIDRRVEFVLANFELINQCEFQELFPDRNTLAQKNSETVVSEISGRVAKHRLALKERADKEAEESAKKKEALRKEEEVSEDKKTSLEDIKSEAEEKENQWHLENWWKKHQKRVHRNLSSKEFTEFAQFIILRISELKGDPPPAEEPPACIAASDDEQDCDDNVAGSAPSTYEFTLKFNLRCTPEQAGELAQRTAQILKDSPYLLGEVSFEGSKVEK